MNSGGPVFWLRLLFRGGNTLAGLPSRESRLTADSGDGMARLGLSLPP